MLTQHTLRYLLLWRKIKGPPFYGRLSSMIGFLTNWMDNIFPGKPLPAFIHSRYLKNLYFFHNTQSASHFLFLLNWKKRKDCGKSFQFFYNKYKLPIYKTLFQLPAFSSQSPSIFSTLLSFYWCWIIEKLLQLIESLSPYSTTNKYEPNDILPFHLSYCLLYILFISGTNKSE